MSINLDPASGQSRRTFIFRKILAAPAGVVAALLTHISWRFLTSPTTGSASTLVLAHPGSLPNRMLVGFEKANVAVFRDGSRLAALSLICTHLGCVLKLRERGFECPCHGSRFDVRGRVLTGPASRNLEWHRVELLADGRAAVRLDELVAAGSFAAIQ